MGAKIGRSDLLFVVMAAFVADIHDFDAASKVVDGWARPSHDVETSGPRTLF
jgi:hypothetical protein